MKTLTLTPKQIKQVKRLSKQCDSQPGSPFHHITVVVTQLHVSFLATDGRVMGLILIPSTDRAPSEFRLDRYALEKLSDKETAVFDYSCANSLKINNSLPTVDSRLYHSNRYQSFFREDGFCSEIVLDKSILVSSLRELKDSPNYSTIVKISQSSDRLILSAYEGSKHAISIEPKSITGNIDAIGFQIKYLVKALTHIPTKEITLRFGKQKEPLIIESADGLHRQLIMYYRLR